MGGGRGFTAFYGRHDELGKARTNRPALAAWIRDHDFVAFARQAHVEPLVAADGVEVTDDFIELRITRFQWIGLPLLVDRARQVTHSRNLAVFDAALDDQMVTRFAGERVSRIVAVVLKVVH